MTSITDLSGNFVSAGTGSLDWNNLRTGRAPSIDVVAPVIGVTESEPASPIADVADAKVDDRLT